MSLLRRHHLNRRGGAPPPPPPQPPPPSSSSVLFFLLLLSTFPLLTSQAFRPATSILLNCGSASDAVLDGRLFLSDASPHFTSSGTSLAVSSAGVSLPALYSTATVFTNAFTYQFPVRTSGTHFLRLHFFPFTTAANTNFALAVARFQVSALDSVLLLANFTAGDAAAPVVKEYLLPVPVDKLLLTFTPLVENGVAFVNAIEFFTAPVNLVAGARPLHVTESGLQTFEGDLGGQAMETVLRVNAGGPLVTPANDTLWRTWVNDVQYLRFQDAAAAVNTSVPVKYRATLPTNEFAPETVYNTAEQMNKMGQRDPQFNVTWNFTAPAPPGAGRQLFFVRMHFCDFMSEIADQLYFNVYLNSKMASPDLHPSEKTNGQRNVPFFLDYIVDGDPSGLVRVSVGRSSKSSSSTANAILNGLEIMKINNSASSLDGETNPLFRQQPGSGANKISVAVVAGAVAGGLFLITVLLLLYFVVFRRKRGTVPEPSKMMDRSSAWTGVPGVVHNSVSTMSGGSGIPAAPRIQLGLLISLEELNTATNGFDETLVIGAGGFGKVYKGKLNDGTAVAVKRGRPSDSRQGYPEFQNEIMVLSHIRHKHLVSLIGYCDENHQMILVYEYMELGTLKGHLYGSGMDPNAPCLSWAQRLKICIGAARGLHYLHTGYSPGIIHRDVKTSNILLDEEYMAKVSDFGLSRLGPSVGESHVSTAVKGSFGYMDPEYFRTQKLTDKSDVYSFGVVMFEVLCARPVIDQQVSREQLNLTEWGVHWQRQGKLEEIVDPKLRGNISPGSLKKFGETAEKCVAECGADRPTIGDVLWNLEYALQLQEMEMGRGVAAAEDSFNSFSQIPAEAAAPTQVEMMAAARRGAGASSDSRVGAGAEVPDSIVFSQLITTEGR